MKILFVLENLADRCGANVNVAITLVKQLSKVYEVHALARYDDEKKISSIRKKEFSKVNTFYANQAGRLSKYTSNDWNKKRRLEKVKSLCKSPKIFLLMFDAKYLDFSITKRKLKRKLVDVCKKEHYDVVIGISAPYYIMQAVAEANIDAMKMAIQLDPFTNNSTLNSHLRNHRRRIEWSVIKNLKVVFAADYIFNDLMTIVSKMKEKVVAMPLPGLVCNNMTDYPKKGNCNNKRINFLFVGQFYEKIRNPQYLLELFLNLPSNYVLHIVGGGCDKEIEKYVPILNDRLVRHGWVSKEEADLFIEKYDILINVNNTITNQLPSKLFEYFSTGKPIVNLCKSNKCLSKPYMEKYENGISIIEKYDIIKNNAEAIKNFVNTHQHIILCKTEIINAFMENTDESVAKLIQSIILKHSIEK